MITITIKDETATGDILNKIQMEIESERISVEDLIELRVRSEVEKYNKMKSESFHGLVRPKTEEILNKKRKFKSIDAEKQVYVALDAFKKNGFFILIDDYQVTELGQELLLNEESEISFLKLTPLVGG